ncbi:hypothetical protein INN71_07115 [Nocardioides sp. ChNu-153]|uniref:DUF6892 domain-containing protein n=1 Tax=unclassified Nocardioides TaxID=2615069 RepID=UPI0024062B8A|nr:MULTISPECIES: hypothetical protein [unclassified Nocardioides]MDF9716691.1 hypothetical protein [Nocardioides sp. ChNu-99]MDN7121159.1 hypothetical protein [Nocardioides sp. ChNu-153]
MTDETTVPARHVDIRLDGVEIDGRLFAYPVLLEDLAQIFTTEPFDIPPSKRNRGSWWWRAEGVAAGTRDEVHAESLRFTVDEVDREVLIEGVPFGEEFGPTGPTYPSRDFGTGFVMVHRSDPGPDQHVREVIVEQKVPRRRAAPRKKAPAPAAPPTPPAVVGFADLNLKLAVVQVLMYEKGLLTPRFVVDDFVDTCEREIDLVTEGHEPIPEVLAHFAALEIPEELLAEVDEIYMDGGNDVYLQVAPQWDGESSAFDVRRWDDLDRLPALRSVTVMGGDEATLALLRDRGIDAQPL